MNLEIHRLTPDRLKDVQYLAKKVYNYHYDLDYLKHKYNSKQYCEIEDVCVLGYVDNKPIAFYGAIPVVLIKGNNRVLFAQTCDSYTLPEFQGKGVHSTLANASYSLMKTYNIKGVFALHSDNTFNACKKLGWESSRNLFLIQITTKILIPWQKILDKTRYTSTLSKNRINKILSSFEKSEKIENIFCKDYYGVDYSREYLSYKNSYFCHILEIQGCKISVKIKSIIYVGAIENINLENANEVISSLKYLAKKLGTDKIVIELDEEHPGFAILSKYLPSKKAYKLGYLCFEETFNFSDVRINYIDFDNFL
jgi:hypothetical protein